MPDEPTKDYPPHGGEGKGAYGAGWPNDELTTHNFRGQRFGPTEVSPLSTDYGGEGNSNVTPGAEGSSAADHFIHPFKLQRYMKKLTAKEIKDGLGGEGNQARDSVRCLRLYYGELWSTISVIKTAAHTVTQEGASPLTIFGISSQLAIPGIDRTVIPDFVNETKDDDGEIRREIYRYVEWRETFSKKQGSDGGAYGIILLTWHVNVDEEPEEAGAGEDQIPTSPLGAITEAYVHRVDTTDDIPEGQLIQALGVVGTDLERNRDNVGVYSMVIGESRDLELEEEDPDNRGQMRLVNEGKAAIDQQVYDHVYYATTLVMGSEGTLPTEPYDFTFIDVPYDPEETKTPDQVVAIDHLQGNWPDDRVVIGGNRNLIGDAQDQ